MLHSRSLPVWRVCHRRHPGARSGTAHVSRRDS